MKINMKLNSAKKVTTGLIITSILAGNVSMVFADNNTLKEEVVYTKLNDNGDVNNIYVINSFDTSSNKNIVDYGNYTNVVNLSTEDVLKYSNGLLDTKVNNKEDKFFYQGDMKIKEIPWDINIEYKLDGQKINTKELAGKSGKLEIKIDIDKNDKVDKSFYDNYATQLSLSLDGDKCKNIKAEDGTIANVGSTKSISYIKLPRESASYTLTTDVKDFEMDPIIINGLNMGMNVNVDLGDMNNSLDTLVNAVGDLNKGTSDLKTGVDSYKTGVNKFYMSSTQLLAGAGQLKTGVNEFKDGVASLNDGAKSLNSGFESLSQGSANYKQNVDNYAASVSQIVSELKAKLPPEMYQQLPLDSLVAGAQGLANGYEAIDNGINSSKAGSGALYNGSQQLANNISDLAKGSEGVYNGVAALSNGSNELVNGIDKIGEGASKLNSGTTQLNNKTSDVPDEIDSKIKEMTSKYSNSNFKPTSFASEKNENIESVQFTIRTEGISVEKKENIVKEEKKEDNPWKMFLNIFKK